MAESLSPPLPEWPRREMAILFTIALALKLLFLVTVLDNPFVVGLTNDEIQHVVEASEILKHGPIRPDAFYFAPLYPYLLAAVFSLFGEHSVLALILHSILGATNVVLVYALALVASGRRRPARLAAAMVMLYGPYWMLEVLVLKTTLATTMSTAAFVGLLISLRHPRSGLWLAGGLLFGLLTLVRGNTLVLIPALVVVLVIYHLKGRLQSRFLWLWLVGIGLGILPATVHNAIAASDLVLTTYQGGTQFWIGNHEEAPGTYVSLLPNRSLPWEEKHDAISIAEHASGEPLFPSQVSTWWLGQGLEYVRSHPGEWLTLILRKAWLFHANAELVDVVDIRVLRELEPQLWLAPLPFGFVVSLAAVGILLTLRRWRDDGVLWVATAASAGSVVLFFVFSRYRTPVVSLYVVLAAIALDRLVRLWRVRRIRQAIPALLAGAAVGVGSFLPVPHNDTSTAWNTLGGLLRRQGDMAGAQACFEKVVAAAPGRILLRTNLALVLEDQGQPCVAIQHRRAIHSVLVARVEAGATHNDLLELVINGMALANDLRVCGVSQEATQIRHSISAPAKWLLAEQQVDRFAPLPWELETLQRAAILNPTTNLETRPPSDG
ncbi:MAG: tetratricopeptide repeat protein [bacterium]|nr:tetratricopeptide repeat protein [bacterium]